MVEVIYDKKIQFEYQDTGHKYLVSKAIGDKWTDPVPVTGITTITAVIAKDALIGWAAKMAAYYMRDNWQTDDVKALAEEAKNAHRSEKTKSAGVGTVGHKLIEALLTSKEVVMPEKPELKVAIKNIRKQHDQFEADFTPKTLECERPLYSLLHNFAGTMDRFCEIGGEKVVIDYKTQNRSYYNPDGIYGSNFAQLGGQILLIEEQLGTKVDDAWIVNFAKDSEEYRLKSLSDMGLSTTDAKLYFLHCLNLYELNKLFEWRTAK